MSLINYFPKGYTPTIEQSKLLNTIQCEFLENDTIIVNAPTGTGKSFVASTIANSSSTISDQKLESLSDYSAFNVDEYGQYKNTNIGPAHGTLILTITKALQDQYVSFFKCASLKGKSNYMSTIDPTVDVEIESAIFPKKLLDTHRLSGSCPYYNDRLALLASKMGVTNYRMFMKLPEHTKQRDYIICDEASELEDELVSQCTCSLNYDRLSRLGINVDRLRSEDHTYVYNWLDDLLDELQTRRKYIQQQLQRRKTWSTQLQTQYRYINNIISTIKSCVDNFYSCEYVIEKNNTDVVMTPLYVDTLSQHVLSHGNKKLLMSATIVDHKSFAKTLGITKYKYIEIDSNFPSESSPIYIYSKYTLNKKNIQRNLPKLTNIISSILDHHKNDKGIIHTHTHHINQYVYETINNDRIISREPGKSNEDIIDQHQKSTTATVLMSPSLCYGVDLKDDLARFQIIIKLPYLPLGNKRVRKLFEQDKNWYRNKMLNTLVQASGRATRSSEDHSVTYILDGLTKKVITTYADILPDYFVQRFV